jgi:hypothetical protein
VLSEEPVSVRQLQPRVPADLETICHRCLQKEPARRYASALDLAEELRRFRAGEPIQARPVRSAERAWRWCRRYPAVAGLLSAVAATLMLGSAVAMYFAIAARTEAGRARDNEQRALDNERRAETEAQKAKTSAPYHFTPSSSGSSRMPAGYCRVCGSILAIRGIGCCTK